MNPKVSTRREVIQKTLYAVGAISLVHCGGTPVGAKGGTDTDLGTGTNPDAAAAARDAAATGNDAAVKTDAATSTNVDAGDIACTLTAEQEEGPYYLSLGNIRSNVTESKPGLGLTLTFTIVDTTTCAVIPNAAVDIWHADASGVYSGYASENTTGETYLRGTQLSDANGRVTFVSIMPGWYAGRAIHIHMKVRIAGTASGATYSGGHVSHTGQVFFAQSIIDTYKGLSPYVSNTTALTTNATDHVWTSEGGSAEVLTVAGDTTSGYLASIVLGVDPSSTPAGVGATGGGMMGGPGGN